MFFKKEIQIDELEIKINAMKERLIEIHKQMIYLRIKSIFRERNIKIDKKSMSLAAIFIHHKYGNNAVFKLSDENIFSFLESLNKKEDDLEIKKLQLL